MHPFSFGLRKTQALYRLANLSDQNKLKNAVYRFLETTYCVSHVCMERVKGIEPHHQLGRLRFYH